MEGLGFGYYSAYDSEPVIATSDEWSAANITTSSDEIGSVEEVRVGDDGPILLQETFTDSFTVDYTNNEATVENTGSAGTSIS